MAVSEEMVDRGSKALMNAFIKKWFLGSYKGPVYLDCVNGEKAWEEEARACLTAALSDQVVGWQTIETAPKDTRVIIFPILREAGVGLYDSVWRCWFTSPGRYSCKPTHWQPLPSTPVPASTPVRSS